MDISAKESANPSFTIPILSAVILAGTGFWIAFFMFMSCRSGDFRAIAITARHVVLADWIFTTPSIIVQFVTGLLLMQTLDYSFTSPWFAAAISLFIFIGACWIPVVFIQYRLKTLAGDGKNPAVKNEFSRLMRVWTVLGILAFSAILIMFWLMVCKPFPIH